VGLLAVKPLKLILAESERQNALKRSLGIGAVVGAGIFTLTGVRM